MRNQPEVGEASGDAWARMADAVGDGEPPADDHGPGEAELLSGQEERLAVPLSHAPTAKLRAALLTTAVHVVKCGGGPIGVTAAGVRNSGRLGLLSKALEVHSRSEDDSQMLAIALEHAMQ